LGDPGGAIKGYTGLVKISHDRRFIAAVSG